MVFFGLHQLGAKRLAWNQPLCFVLIVSSLSAFNDLSEHEERLMRFLNLSRTTVSKEMVPSQPQPTADSPHNPPTTAADSQDPTTTVKDTVNTQDSRNKEVEYCFYFDTNVLSQS